MRERGGRERGGGMHTRGAGEFLGGKYVNA